MSDTDTSVAAEERSAQEHRAIMSSNVMAWLQTIAGLLALPVFGWMVLTINDHGQRIVRLEAKEEAIMETVRSEIRLGVTEMKAELLSEIRKAHGGHD